MAVLAGPASVWASANGTSWRRDPDPCYDRSQGIDLAGLAVPKVNVLFELCAGNPGAGQEAKSLRLSTDGGITSHLVSNLPLGGQATGPPPPTAKTLSSMPPRVPACFTTLERRATWGTKTFDDGGAGLYDLQFATPALGAVVEGRPGLGASSNRLLISRDGGTTWQASRL